MIKARMAKIAAFGIAVLCLGALAGCSGNSSVASGTAATVNGTAISETEVTTTIESIRAQAGLSDTDQWGTWLVANNMTPADVRADVIDSLAERVLVKAGATEKGVTIDAAEIDSYVGRMKGNYASDEAWQEALKQAGFTEDSYRASIELSLLQQELLNKFQDEAEVTDAEILESAKTYATYYQGGKRSSHILFVADDRDKAQEVLDKINSGELDFAQAAKDYSIDGSAENGGDVGWDVTTTFVTEYQDALDKLEKGQVSDLVPSQFGIHIIKCTDSFNVEGELTDINQLPSDIRETVVDRAKYLAGVNAFQEWIKGLKDSATIEIKDMPSNVPYSIDLTKYQKAAEAAAAATAASSDAAASADAASADAASGDAASAESASSDAAASADAASSDAAASADAASADSSKG